MQIVYVIAPVYVRGYHSIEQDYNFNYQYCSLESALAAAEEFKIKHLGISHFDVKIEIR